MVEDGVEPQQALLIDGHNLIFRGFSSVPKSITDPEGRPVNGVYGMLGTLLRLIRDRAATHCAIAFDMPEIPTFRHKAFPAYQGQRGPLGGADAENFAWQVDQAKLVLALVGLRTLTAPGFEADDIIGTLAAMGVAAGIPSVIVSTDRDLQQLARPMVRVLIPGKAPLEIGPDEVKERLGIAPHRIVDWKALAGDPSDNIPGVPGIGSKTAIVLVEQFGSWRKVYENLDAVSARQRAALEAGRADAELFADIVRVRDDLDLGVTFDDLRIDHDRLPARAGDALRDAGLRPA
jgi:DNA polymerase-1